jgi:preprotein translocase subunit SecG
LVVGMGHDFSNDSNILSVLSKDGVPVVLTKITVFMFAFVMLIPAIPVNLLISNEK